MNQEHERAAVATVIRDGLERQGRGSKARLAAELDVSPATVTKWVQGHTIPELSRWHEIETALDLGRGELAQAAGINPEGEAVELRREVGELRAAVENLSRDLRRLLPDE